MVFTDCARALVIASLPLLTVLGLLSVWWMYVVSFVNATLTIGFTAANFAALPSLVEPDDLIAANGSLQASFSMASIIGPLVAGLLLVRVPLPLFLLIDAASFLVWLCGLDQDEGDGPTPGAGSKPIEPRTARFPVPRPSGCTIGRGRSPGLHPRAPAQRRHGAGTTNVKDRPGVAFSLHQPSCLLIRGKGPREQIIEKERAQRLDQCFRQRC